MKKRFRVLRTIIGGDWTNCDQIVYIPQYKGWLFWKSFYDNMNRRTLYFCTQDDAVEFIKNRIRILEQMDTVVKEISCGMMDGQDAQGAVLPVPASGPVARPTIKNAGNWTKDPY